VRRGGACAVATLPRDGADVRGLIVKMKDLRARIRRPTLAQAAAGVAVVAVLALLIGLIAVRRPEQGTGENVTPRFAPLTGVRLSEDEYLTLKARRPISVMLDNISLAQPISGVDRADVIIEALAEGGIPRLLAVYHSMDADYIEPVRSARTSFLYWALEYDAMYAHVGSAERAGPANAGAQIIEWNVSDLDYEGGTAPARTAFSRNPNREAPHNVFTSTERLRAEGVARGYERELEFSPWQFSDQVSLGAPTTTLGVDFGASYAPRWDWDPAVNTFVRTQYGALQRDGYSGGPITASNVVVVYANAQVVDSSGHVLYDLLGEGRAQLFINGQAFEAIWRKEDIGGRTRVYSPDGQEAVFAPGKTWIEVVPLSGSTTISMTSDR
jgi:Protein of unknown function (DUF3048) N-terminal domain/Protein of unknown function (DUF3048) C-terminal domain